MKTLLRSTFIAAPGDSKELFYRNFLALEEADLSYDHAEDGVIWNDLKKRYKYGFLMGLDTPDHVAGGLARYIAVTGGIDDIDRFYKQLDSVTPQDIMKAAQKYFTPEQRTVVVLKGAQS